MWPQLLASSLAAILSAPPAAPAPAPRRVEPKMMAALTVSVTMQPILASADAFRDPANATAVTSALEVLALPHPLPSLGQPMNTAGELALQHARQVRRAKEEYLRGEHEPARHRLRTVNQLCLGCHLRRPGAQSVPAGSQLVEAVRLEPLQRASLLASFRDYDGALAVWRDTLRGEARNDAEAFEHLQAWRTALDVAVRGKADPRAVLALLDGLDERDDFPQFVLVQLDFARREARAWSAEALSVGKASPGELVAKARALVELSGAAKTPAGVDLHPVSLLRAAAYLDEALARQPDAPWRGEALYLLGVVSASVNEPYLWQLEVAYLEACIRENARLPLARECYRRLYDRALFTWARFADMPSDDVGWLSRLRALSP